MEIKRKEITFTHNSAIAKIKSQLFYARQARKLNCNRVAKVEYDRAQFLISFFYELGIINKKEYEKICAEVSIEVFTGEEATF